MTAPEALARIGWILRIGLGAVWLWSAFVSEFIAPHEQTLALLAEVGLRGDFAPLFLHGASALDALIGLLTLAGVRVRWVAFGQAALIAFYTLLLVGRVPELWAHPFAPLGKNIGLVAAALALALTDSGQREVP